MYSTPWWCAYLACAVKLWNRKRWCFDFVSTGRQISKPSITLGEEEIDSPEDPLLHSILLYLLIPKANPDPHCSAPSGTQVQICTQTGTGVPWWFPG